MVVQDNKDLLGLMTIGRICRMTLEHMANHLQPGISTKELDEIGAAFLKKHGAVSAPIMAYKFPGHTCISINDEAAHGIPSPDRIIQAGDMVNIDVSAVKNGYWADNGASYAVPPVKPEVERLLKTTRKALDLSLEIVRDGVRVYEVGKVIEPFAHQHGYEVIEELGGHGVGRHIHEKPSIPFYFNKRAKQKLTEGLVITLEPFLTLGGRHIKTMPDGWTLKTTDGSLSAQFEHTIIVTKNEPIIVTALG
ncbi:MAG: type I methionyl aminopeptidase [Phototrophicales bacterium]|nr:MAG: type I methionyl aminopeptidase [Phototrophicales bacterium]RMG76905.1 MAG: type I methionyl aminopeptidase [Chloroflexota bacterium]